VKYFISLFIICFLMFGCAAPQKYADVSINNFKERCTNTSDSADVSYISFPIPARVLRHSDCLGVQDLLLILMPSAEGKLKTETAAKLLAIMYTEHKSKELNEYETISVEHIKTDLVEYENVGLYGHFFLVRQTTEAPPVEN